jgi:hypothetical protein
MMMTDHWIRSRPEAAGVTDDSPAKEAAAKPAREPVQAALGSCSGDRPPLN